MYICKDKCVASLQRLCRECGKNELAWQRARKGGWGQEKPLHNLSGQLTTRCDAIL
jgi:hypothetical protein